MEVFLARQPIFDAKQNIKGYEILYRSGYVNRYDGVDGDKSSRHVIFNTFQTFGLQSLTSGKPVFINFTGNLISDETATLFPRELLVVEILEDVIPSRDIIESCKAIKKMGYTIALDDFALKSGYEELIELADIIKIDFLLSSQEEIIELREMLEGKTLLAEKIETRDQFNFARGLGFSLFQGYFFSEPEIIKTKTMQPIKLAYIQLLNLSKKSEIDFNRITDIISMDLSLTYNLFKLVNSAAFGFRYEIKTIRHAVVALGEREIKKWISLVIVNSIGQDKADELTNLSLIRARFMELIGEKSRLKNHHEELFLIGLFSLLDVILNKPMGAVLNELNASKPIKNALLRGEGEFGRIYKMAKMYEQGQWDEFFSLSEKLDIDQKMIATAYMEALQWVHSFKQQMRYNNL